MVAEQLYLLSIIIQWGCTSPLESWLKPHERSKMRRFDVRDITEDHFRELRRLIHFKKAEAHIVVRTKHAWPPTIAYSRRQEETVIVGDGIH